MDTNQELVNAVKELQKELRSTIKFDVRKHFSLMTADAAVSTLIAKMEGKI